MLISLEQKALIGQVFETYLAELHHDDILQLIAEDDEETHHPVVVNAMTLFEASMEVGDYFNAYPHDVLAIFDKVLQRTALDLSQNVFLRHNRGERTEVKPMKHTFHTRITGLPVCTELTRDTIPRSRDVGHFLSLTGTVIRTSVAKVLEYERDFMCQKCRHVFSMQTEFEQFYVFAPPMTCPNPDGCNSYKFSCLSGGSEPAACRDYQEIKIQEQVQRLSVGSIPRSMVVVLEDDLVDSCKSGDDVTIYGVVCQRWKPFHEGIRSDVELVVKANNIEVNNQQTSAAMLSKEIQQEFEAFWSNYKHDSIAGRNQILLSLCPQVFGMFVIKLAVAMVLAGGVQRIDPSGTKIRGECHMLLVGDPGTGKSQFLKYSAKIMPRSVLTAGIGSTSAGLTVAAVKDAGDWHLEAGALVLSDGGLCCIDEFNSIKEHDRISIHEAMEQQSISVAKAGMVCKLNTRSTILAATNPKGQYNPNEPLSVNVALASPLLSRFDLVLVLLDTRNSEWDHSISSFILENRGLCAESSDLWPMEKMKAYFSAIKRLQPQMSQEANSILTRYYQLQRQSDGRNAARTTIRMLESLSRLAEAHARLMYRERVTIQDAVMAVSVMECSMQGGALLGNVNTLLTSFPADPGQQYEAQCKVLLEELNLPLLLEKEMDRLARLNINVSDTSQFESPTAHCQRPCIETNTDNKTDRHDITGDSNVDSIVKSGLDWFHSITSPLSRDDLNPPIVTSTKERNKETKKAPTVMILPNCQAAEDIKKNTYSRLTHKETVIFASGDENTDKSKKNKYRKENSFRNKDVHQPEKPKDDQHSESSECVVQKVSKNLRYRRLSQLELNDPPCNKVWEYGESAVSFGGTNKIVADVLNTTSNSHRSNLLYSVKWPLTNHIAQSNQSCCKKRKLEEIDKINQMETKNKSCVPRQKVAAEANTTKDLHAQLSDFAFKPRKSPSLIHDHNFPASSNMRVETKFNPDSRTGKQNLSKCNESAHSPTDAEENERNENQNQEQNLIEGECSSKCVKNFESTTSKVGESGSEINTGFTSRKLDKEKKGKEKSINNRDNTIVNYDKCNPTLNASTEITDSAPGLTNSTIFPSTMAKLSRFSFTSITKPTTTAQDTKPTTTAQDTKPTTTAQEQVELRPSSVVEKCLSKRNISECLRTNSDVKETEASPEHSSLSKKIRNLVTMDKADTVLAPTVTVLPQGQEHEQGRESLTKWNCKAKQTELTGAAKRIMDDDDPLEYESSVTVKKQKSFELGPPSRSGNGSKGLFPGLSLFGSVEASNDVFDTDWDQELS